MTDESIKYFLLECNGQYELGQYSILKLHNLLNEKVERKSDKS